MNELWHVMRYSRSDDEPEKLVQPVVSNELRDKEFPGCKTRTQAMEHSLDHLNDYTVKPNRIVKLSTYLEKKVGWSFAI